MRISRVHYYYYYYQGFCLFLKFASLLVTILQVISATTIFNVAEMKKIKKKPGAVIFFRTEEANWFALIKTHHSVRP